jgi:hypothetical protein
MDDAVMTDGASEVFVGRSVQTARLFQAIERATAGEGALLLVTGESGIGKTRLAARAAAEAARRGMRVVWGRCSEPGGAGAYFPWLQVFRGVDLPSPFIVGEDDSEADAQQVRFRIFDAAVERLLGAARATPLFLVLDDLHAGDIPSLLLLQLLTKSLRGARLLVVGTYRDAEARLVPEVGALLAKLARDTESIPLPGLSEAELASWLRSHAPAIEDARVAEVYRLTEGNPLFVEEALALGDDAWLPDGTRALLDAHLARLSAPTRELLEAAAVLGRESSADQLARLIENDRASAELSLEQARGAGVLSVTRDAWSFRHVLLRDRVYAALSPTRRAVLHWRAGEACADSRDDLPAAAHHLLEGYVAGSLERALEGARDAARYELDRLAFEEAAATGQRALTLLEGRAPTRVACELMLVMAEALFRSGAAAKARETCTRAAAIAKSLGASDIVSHAALVYGTDLVSGTVDPVMVSLLRDALASNPPGDDLTRARLMARLAAALAPPRVENVPEVLALSRDAAAMARRVGDPETLLYSLRFAISGAGYVMDGEERFVIVREIVALARALNHRFVQLTIAGPYAGLLLERGFRAEAEMELEALGQLVAEVKHPSYQWRLPMLQGVFATFDGDLDAAARLGDEALEIGQLAGSSSARLSWALSRIALAHARGEPRWLDKDSARVLQIIGWMPAMLPYQAWVCAAAGQREEAILRLSRIPQGVDHFPWLVVAADVASMLSDRDVASRFYDPLRAAALKHRLFWGPAGAFALGPTSRILGDLARVLERFDAARAHYTTAIAECRLAGARPLLALAERALADMAG